MECQPSIAGGKSQSPTPSRLQKRAPAALRLDGIRTASKLHHPCSDAFSSSSSPAAIPLLSPIPLFSPLMESPRPLEPEVEVAPGFSGGSEIVIGGGQPEGVIDHQVEGPPTPVFGGWQHPAAASSASLTTEPSKLLALFRSQCSLVNPTQ